MARRRQATVPGDGGLPDGFRCGGRVYRLSQVLKDDRLTAVGLYADGPHQVVLKLYRGLPFLGVRIEWPGRLMANHEAAVLEHLSGIPGVPALLGRWGRAGLVREFVPGAPLKRKVQAGPLFLRELFRLLRRLHARGVAYVDLEKRDNILVGTDGRPHLIDFQIAFYVPRRLGGDTLLCRWLRNMLQEADVYHARKHCCYHMAGQLNRRQSARLRRKPWFVRAANYLRTPVKETLRWLRDRRRYGGVGDRSDGSPSRSSGSRPSP